MDPYTDLMEVYIFESSYQYIFIARNKTENFFQAQYLFDEMPGARSQFFVRRTHPSQDRMEQPKPVLILLGRKGAGKDM